MNIGAQIRQHREALGLSQEQLAERIFVTRQTISHWECGKSYPDAQSLLLLSKVFGTPVDALMRGDAEMMYEAMARERSYDMMRKGLMVAGTVGSAAIWTPLARDLGAALGTAAALIPCGIALAAATTQKKASAIAHDTEAYREVLALPRELAIECPARVLNRAPRVLDSDGSEPYRMERRAETFIGGDLWRMRYWRLTSTSGRRVANLGDRILGGTIPDVLVEGTLPGGGKVSLRRSTSLVSQFRSTWRLSSNEIQIEGDLLAPRIEILKDSDTIARLEQARVTSELSEDGAELATRRYELKILDGSFAQTALVAALTIALARAHEAPAAFVEK